MKGNQTIREARPGDIETIRSLADRIWRACYPGIISEAQIDFMLGWMYSAGKIREEMEGSSIRYLIASEPDSDKAQGFAAFGPGEESHEVFLHKLYVLPECQRRGIGSALMADVERRSRSSSARTISLRVNRENGNAICAYEKAGFRKTQELCSDIGGGFVMDDFLMTKRLEPPDS
jgi:diamine N-acetyltransferase